MSRKFDRFPPIVVTPIVLTIIALAIGFDISRWYLAAIPFIWLGAFFSTTGKLTGCVLFFPFLSIFSGFILSFFNEPLGIAIATGTCLGFILATLEKINYLRPPED